MAAVAEVVEPNRNESPGTHTVRVLHLINGEHYAGAEKVQDLLAEALPEFGYEVAFACVRPGRFAEARRYRQAPVYETPMRSRFDVLRFRDVARLLREGEFELLHTHTPRTAMIGRLAARRAGRPMVHHVHMQTATEVNRNWKTRVTAWTERVSLAGAAATIAVSNSSRDYIRRLGAPEDRLTVVPNGIPPLDPPPRDPPAAGETWTLGTVGLFRPRKGLETLLRGLSGLRGRGLPVRLRAVGPFETEEYEREVHRLAAELRIADAVQWLGFRRDVAEQLLRMDLFVFPSVLPEGMPMVLLEAMAAGAPIVASRVQGVTDVIRDEANGLLVAPGLPEELADGVASLIGAPDRWASLRKNALAEQRRRFSQESMARGVAEVYDSVLGRCRR